MMAGIGFELRRLYTKDSLSGLVQLYVNAAIASAGPWLLAVAALGFTMMLAGPLMQIEALNDFKSIIIYNFCFSLVLSGPIFMILTRYLSDRIYGRDVSMAPSAMMGSIVLFSGIGLPLAGWFYFGYAKLSATMALLAVINFMLIGVIWLSSVFLSALKDYKSVSLAFFVGLFVAVVTSAFFSTGSEATGLMVGYNVGFVIVVAMLVARVFIEYPYRLNQPFSFLSYFRKYWEIAVGGLLYNCAIWVDKWMMWGAPEAQKLPNGLLMYPNYDSAMFLAFLTIIPSAALFLFYVETDFFRAYLQFYRDIQQKATYVKITHNHKQLVMSIFNSMRDMVLVQGSLCLAAIMAAPTIIGILHGGYLQVGILRFGILGAFFHAMMLFFLILLSYFDRRKEALFLCLFFFLSNAGFTGITLYLGFSYYGYGYFLSSMLACVLTAWRLVQHLRCLPYHAFITSNASIKR